MGTYKENTKVLSSDMICSVTLLVYGFTEYMRFQSQKHRFCSYAVGIWKLCKLFAVAAFILYGTEDFIILVFYGCVGSPKWEAKHVSLVLFCVA